MIRNKILLLKIGMICFLFGLSCDGEVDYKDFVKAEQQINEKQKEVFELSKKLGQDIREIVKHHPDKKLKFNPEFGLTDDQQKVLLEMIKNEKEPSLKGSLKVLVEKNKQITDLRKAIRDLEAKLPTHYVVTKGDTHYDISLDFLKKVHNLSDDRAKKLVKKSALYDELEVGFKVWLYYNDDVFGTFVTQGTAKISPYKMKRDMKKAREDEIFKQGYEKGRMDILSENESQ